MRITTEQLNILEKKAIQFVQDELKKSGFKKLVLGISGGIDSALSVAIACKAIGPENVLGIMMPYKLSSKESLIDANRLVEKFKFRSKIFEITPMIDRYFEIIEKEEESSSLRKGNKMARERMSILFDHAAMEDALVLGTSNKTEILLGYSTQFGDAACSFNPIGQLYKQEIWALSKHMGVPQELIDKKPSADLWEGQTDEQELGFSYIAADLILKGFVDDNKTIDELAKDFKNSQDSNINIITKDIIEKVVKRMKATEFKRRLPLVANL